MDFDNAKENIQPLSSGRNANILNAALYAETHSDGQEELQRQRLEYKAAIDSYDGNDPLMPWFDYIFWVEQSCPKSGKESALDEIILEVISRFEADERYNQDQRMIKLYSKYIDSQENPQEYYQALWNKGIGTMVADLYICWAYYYDVHDNFPKAEEIFRKGFDARAQPIEDLETAHKNFGFSMSQRILHKDDSTKQGFLSSMEERRQALTCLRAFKRKHVGSMRTGSAIKSPLPGKMGRSKEVYGNENTPLNVYEDEKSSSTITAGNVSVVQSIVDSVRKQENMREPGPWSKAKSSKRVLIPVEDQHALAFPICEDSNDEPIIVCRPEDLHKGLKLPENFARKNVLQELWKVPIIFDDEIKQFTLPMYDKMNCYPGHGFEYSPEELNAHKWFKKSNITNKRSKEYERNWPYDRIRLPPNFCAKNLPQPDLNVERCLIDNSILSEAFKMVSRFDEIYPENNKDEEFSIEELMKRKWKKPTKIRKTIYIADPMDETLIVQRKEELSRKSRFIPRAESPITCEKSDESRAGFVGFSDVEIIQSTGILKNEPFFVLPDPEVHEEEVKAQPIVVFEDAKEEPAIIEEKERISDSTFDEVFQCQPIVHKTNIEETYQISPIVVKPKFSIFEDTTIPEVKSNEPEIKKTRFNESPEKPKKVDFPIFEDSFAQPDPVPAIKPNFIKPAVRPFLHQDETNETVCNTQHFNLFLKSSQASTPSGKLSRKSIARKPIPDFDLDDFPTNEVVTSPAALETIVSPELTENTANKKQLSTIMETTESNTISSTKSSVSSSPEVDYESMTSPRTATKNIPRTNNLETITENSNELSIKRPEIPSLNISSPGIPTNKVYETPCKSICPIPDSSVNVTKSFIKKPELLDTDEIMDFFTTTPENKRNKFGSSQMTQKKAVFNESITCPENSYIPRMLEMQKNISVLPSFSCSKFEMTEQITEPILVKSSQVKKNVSVLPSFSDMSKLEVTEPILLKSCDVKKNVSFAEVCSMKPSTFADMSKMDNITESNFKLTQISGNSTKIQNFEESLLRPAENQKARSFYQRSQSEPEESFKLDFSLKKEKSMSINDGLTSIPSKPRSILDSFKEIKDLSIKADDLSIDILIDGEDFDQDEFGKSIYIPKSPIKQAKRLTDDWDELSSDSKPFGSFYHPIVDLDETQQRLDGFLHTKNINPFDTNMCDAFLEKVDFYTFLKEEVLSCTMVNKVRPMKPNSILTVGKESFEVSKCIGEGAFGKVFVGRSVSNHKVVALKQERPANYWEYYIMLELHTRLCNAEIIPGFMNVEHSLIGNNASILISDYCPYGNLLDVCNNYKTLTSRNLDESITMIISSQLLAIVDHLHACDIIHGDIKPDNIMFISPLSFGSRKPCIKLIDFGNSIDMQLFAPGTEFRHRLKTKNFTCVEMIEDRPWTYQTDLFCVASTFHTLLFGRYMEVQKKAFKYEMKTPIPRYFNKVMWAHIFDTLINIRDCSTMPNLQELKLQLEEEIHLKEAFVKSKILEFNRSLKISNLG